jgi:hypothetical protein
LHGAAHGPDGTDHHNGDLQQVIWDVQRFENGSSGLSFRSHRHSRVRATPSATPTTPAST